MSKFTLKDLGNLTGIKTDTIRIWERRYKILSPNHTPTNRKWYDDEDLKKLINISILYHNGLKISRIALLTDSEIMTDVSSITEGTITADNIIGALVIATNGFDEQAVDELIMKSVISRGFEKTFTDVLFPFLHKIGLMWHTGAINPSTEHFITAILRKRIITAADALPGIDANHKKRVLMFLPEGEYHELGLLFYCYIIKKRGHGILYLGQSTPLDSVISAVENWKPDIIITGIQSALFTSDPEEYLTKLGAIQGRHVIYAGGRFADHSNKMNQRNVKALRTEADLDFLI